MNTKSEILLLFGDSGLQFFFTYARHSATKKFAGAVLIFEISLSSWLQRRVAKINIICAYKKVPLRPFAQKRVFEQPTARTIRAVLLDR